MKKYMKVVKNPTESGVIMVTKTVLMEMKEQYPAISIGPKDRKYLKDFKDDDIVGVVAGELADINDKNADLWFVNIEYFNEHYTIIEGE